MLLALAAPPRSLDGRNRIELVERVVLARFSACFLLGRRQRDGPLTGILFCLELEEDDGDVVLAAALVRGAHEGLRGRAKVVTVTADRFEDPLVGAAPAVAATVARVVAHRRGRQARRQLAGLRAADPVGDREQRRLADVGVLVVPAPPPGIRDRCRLTQLHASYLS